MIDRRPVPTGAAQALAAAGAHPVVARLLAARGLTCRDDLEHRPDALLPPAALHGIDGAARVLAQAIDGHRRILVIADYDCDGATACAVAVRGLRMMGAQVDYLVPNRFEHGYGLTPAIVELALADRTRRPELIVTVDNGIASVDGVALARSAGVDVLVTDHHLPGPVLPEAVAIVNPNQPGCTFPSKHLAGVGVMFYVLLALRARLRDAGRWAGGREPALQQLLDLVALGTVADLVRLDRNNRILVTLGIKRIRAGQCCPGIRALLSVAGREARRLSSADLGFAVGPRINAAGRLSDITVGIECLITDDAARADQLARMLDAINRERRDREATMRSEALSDADTIDEQRRSVVLFREGWHEGIVGLVASKLKDRHHRPTVAFAPSASDPSRLRGSGRSIPGVHLRDALDLVSKRHPELIERFGGHAMAAGLTLHADGLQAFTGAFEQAVAEIADDGCFRRVLLTDGSLAPGEIDLELCEALSEQVWGQGFSEPLFVDRFEVESQRLVGERHTKLSLLHGGRRLSAIAFGHTDPLPRTVSLAYRIARDDYGGRAGVQLMIEAVEPETI